MPLRGTRRVLSWALARGACARIHVRGARGRLRTGDPASQDRARAATVTSDRRDYEEDDERQSHDQGHQEADLEAVRGLAQERRDETAECATSEDESAADKPPDTGARGVGPSAHAVLEPAQAGVGKGMTPITAVLQVSQEQPASHADDDGNESPHKLELPGANVAAPDFFP